MIPELAQASSFTGEWFKVAALGVNVLFALGALAAFFATRREVQDIDRRVTTLEQVNREMVEKVENTGLRLSTEGSKRASTLHTRIDDLQQELGEMKGGITGIAKNVDMLVAKEIGRG